LSVFSEPTTLQFGWSFAESRTAAVALLLCRFCEKKDSVISLRQSNGDIGDQVETKTCLSKQASLVTKSVSIELIVRTTDIIVDYYRATEVNLPALAGQLGATNAIPIIYVPLSMITHIAAFYLLVRAPGGNSRVG
jgi:hypothetical protein